MSGWSWLAAGVLGIALLPATVSAADLVVVVESIDARGKGKLALHLYDSAGAWAGMQAPVRRVRGDPQGRRALEFRIAGLAPGEYAVMVMHDLDGNGRFDRNALGIPSDGYGFSNNPVVFAKPGFARVRMPLPADGARIRVRMR